MFIMCYDILRVSDIPRWFLIDYFYYGTLDFHGHDMRQLLYFAQINPLLILLLQLSALIQSELMRLNQCYQAFRLNINL